MNLFRFLNPTSPTKFERGEIINGLTSAIWIERYREAGEFTLKARIDSNIRAVLPIGSCISHVDTKDIMIVENHELNNKKDLTSEITITGRSFETFLENRIVGTNREFPRDFSDPAYFLWDGPIGTQALDLIKDHIDVERILDPDDAIPYLTVLSTVPEIHNFPVKFERKELYPQLIDLLAVKDLGIKIIRPNALSPLGFGTVNFAMVIHQGEDKSDNVILTTSFDDINNADYFWSSKKVKNCALVTSKWFEIMVKPVISGYTRRVMFVDGRALDDSFDEMPVGIPKIDIITSMTSLGERALANQKEIAIRNVDTTKVFDAYVFGVDYDIGDIISVTGDFNESAKMRVIEYVRIEDKAGRSEYPTFSMI